MGKINGDEEKWRDFWQKDCRSYYFIGKDNIAFHTIIWPAMLMVYGGLNLPFDVPANEFLSIEGKKGLQPAVAGRYGCRIIWTNMLLTLEIFTFSEHAGN